MKKNSYFFPLILILIGSLMLVHQLGIWYIGRPDFFIILFTILGGILVRKGFLDPRRKGILGSTFFFLMALMLILMKIGYIPIDDRVAFPMVLINLGIANVVYYLISKRNISNLTLGVIFLAISTPFILIYYNSVPWWEVSDLFSTYWPVLIITLGIGLFVDGMLKKAK